MFCALNVSEKMEKLEDYLKEREVSEEDILRMKNNKVHILQALLILIRYVLDLPVLEMQPGPNGRVGRSY